MRQGDSERWERIAIKLSFRTLPGQAVQVDLTWRADDLDLEGSACATIQTADCRSLWFFGVLGQELARHSLHFLNSENLETPEFRRILRHVVSTFKGGELLLSRKEEYAPLVNDVEALARTLHSALRVPVHQIILAEASTFGASFPRLWELLRFLPGRQTREQVFEPAYNDLLADHLTTRSARFQTPWARRWIKLCFALRTAWLIGQCAAVGLRGTVAALLIPRWLREWLGPK